MIRKRLPSLIASVVFAFVLNGCHGVGESVKQTYVNQDDPAQTLELKSQSSLHMTLASHFHNVKWRGEYVLRTDDGTSSGSVTFFIDDDGSRGYAFKPEKGESWTVQLGSDASFKDARGTWQVQRTTFDKEAAVVKVGG